MQIFKMFYDKNYYKNLYNNLTIPKFIIYILFACLMLSIITVKNITNKKIDDLIFINNFISELPNIIQYDKQKGLSIFDKDNNIISFFENENLYIDTTKYIFNEKELNISSLSKHSIAIKIVKYKYKVINLINILKDKEFSNLKFEILSDNNINVFYNENFLRKFSNLDILKIIKQLILFIKLFLFIFIVFITLLIYILFAIFENFIIRKKQNKTFKLKNLIFTFTPLIYINLLLALIFNLILNINIIIVYSLSFFISMIYSNIISNIFLKDLKKEYITKNDSNKKYL